MSKIRHTSQLLHRGNLSQRQIGAALGISKSTWVFRSNVTGDSGNVTGSAVYTGGAVLRMYFEKTTTG